jgi:hypothetical protein
MKTRKIIIMPVDMLSFITKIIIIILFYEADCCLLEHQETLTLHTVSYM